MDDLTKRCADAANRVLLDMPQLKNITTAQMILVVQRAVLAGAQVGLMERQEPVRKRRAPRLAVVTP
jgi:hypothetical protein